VRSWGYAAVDRAAQPICRRGIERAASQRTPIESLVESVTLMSWISSRVRDARRLGERGERFGVDLGPAERDALSSRQPLENLGQQSCVDALVRGRAAYAHLLPAAR